MLYPYLYGFYQWPIICWCDKYFINSNISLGFANWIEFLRISVKTICCFHLWPRLYVFYVLNIQPYITYLIPIINYYTTCLIYHLYYIKIYIEIILGFRITTYCWSFSTMIRWTTAASLNMSRLIMNISMYIF